MKIRKSLVVRALALVLGFSATIGTVSTDASACGGGWYEEVIQIDHRPYGLTIAEKKIDHGDYRAASGIIIRMIPHIKQLKVTSSDIVERAHHVLAVSIARSDGQLDVGDQVPRSVQGTWLGETEEDRAENLEWSIDSLRKLSKARDGDPATRTDLAEALSKVDDHRAEAKQILEKLAKKDLIATPQGYAVLAELRAEKGDEAGQRVALERCKAMAVNSQECGARPAVRTTTAQS